MKKLGLVVTVLAVVIGFSSVASAMHPTRGLPP